MPGDNIAYCNLPSPLGEMIAGATEHGLCFLEWHDRGGVERILERVRSRYACTVVPGENPHLALLRGELEAYFAGELHAFTVPLAIRGTSFERLVWDELLRIPYGQTRSYGQIGTALGRPGCSRAVGRANGANYLSIVIPCHRVIEANGNLRGYGGGLWRKKHLLELEGVLLKL